MNTRRIELHMPDIHIALLPSRRMFALRVLPFLGTGLLLYTLSGGLPPPAWLMLFQIVSRFSALQAEQGGWAVFDALLILSAQSLFLACVWGIVLWLAVREGRVLFAARVASQQSISASITAEPAAELRAESIAHSTRPVLSSSPDEPMEQLTLSPAGPDPTPSFSTSSPDSDRRTTEKTPWDQPADLPEPERKLTDAVRKRPRLSDNGEPHSTTTPFHLLTLLGCVGAGMLLFWLSGGFPPTVWRVMQETLVQFSTLQELQGAGAIFTLFLLGIRSLSMLVAWGILLWLALHEGRVLLNSRSYPYTFNSATPFVQISNDAGASSADALSRSERRAAATTSRSFERKEISDASQARPAPGAARPPLLLTEAAVASPGPDEEKRTPFSTRQESDRLASLTEHPFLVFEELEEEIMPDPFAESEINHEEVRSVVWPTDLSPQQQRMFSVQASGSYETLEGSSKHLAESSPGEEAVPPASQHLSALLRELDFFGGSQQIQHLQPSTSPEAVPTSEASQPTPPAPRAASGLIRYAREPQKQKLNKTSGMRQPSSPPSEASQGNPFDVQSDVAHLFDQENSFAQQPAEVPGENSTKRPAARRPQKAEPLFVYGNPFDGELPEVFHHDEDLKRELREQLAEQHEQSGSL